ncbi:MAG: PASTA domain-containing protein, partial [Oscillospiraceae bacterium]|nr:PASTA domain-containing protein [Oscillospiraceae bacterium]
LTVSSAISKLKVSGFIVSRVSKQVSHSVPPGNVMTQVPGPGAAVPQGSGVHITVSDGTHK